MSRHTPLVLFGGTFDPIHGAHLRAALAVSRVLGGAEVRLLPNATPPHRPQPCATGRQRLAMIRRACAYHPLLQADPWELARVGPSYTLATLHHYRRQIGRHRPLVFLIGADSLANLDSWHQWQRYAALCHLAVVPRPGSPEPSVAIQRAFPRAPASWLRRRPAGRRLMLHQPQLRFSSTRVRTEIAENGRSSALTSAVESYIRRHGLYTVTHCQSRNNEAP